MREREHVRDGKDERERMLKERDLREGKGEVLMMRYERRRYEMNERWGENREILEQKTMMMMRSRRKR